MDARDRGGLTGTGFGEMIGVIEFVESNDFLLTKPIPIHVHHEYAGNHWIASFRPAGICADGKKPRDAIEALRRLLVSLFGMWVSGESLPEPWHTFYSKELPFHALYAPDSLSPLEEHFGRKPVDA